jgi:hypothetical protein
MAGEATLKQTADRIRELIERLENKLDAGHCPGMAAQSARDCIEYLEMATAALQDDEFCHD